MKCVRCGDELRPPCFTKTPEQLEERAERIIDEGSDRWPEHAATAVHALAEIVRFRRGHCWGCGYDARRAREDVREAEAQDAMSSEGGVAP